MPRPRKNKSAPVPLQVVPAPLPENLWDIEDVQKFLGVSRTRVFQLRRTEGLPYIKWDRTVRYDPSAVKQWAVQRQQRSA